MSFITRLFKRKQEQRSITWDDGYKLGIVGTTSPNNLESALALSSVYCCVRVISEGVAALPLILYQRSNEGKNRATQHPLFQLLKCEPNGETTAYSFWETMVLHWAVYGNAYAEIQRDNSGRPIALFPLDSRHVKIARDATNNLYYQYQYNNGNIDLASEDILHIPGLSIDGTQGLPLLKLAQQALNLTEKCEEYGRSFFANCSRPSGLLKTAGQLSDQARNNLKTSWEQLHSGSSNAGKIAVLEEGLDYTQTSLTNEEGQYNLTRQHQILELCRFFNVPPHRCKALDRATWGNIEAENISFVTDTLRPILIRFEQEINRKLLLSAEKQEYYVEFLVDGLLRGDTTSRYGVYQMGLQNKIFSVNEVRAFENMNKILDPKFDIPGIPQLEPAVPQPLPEVTL